MVSVNYISACMDLSGYAAAARHNIAALDSVGVKVEVSAVSFEKYRSDLGELGRKIQSLSVIHPESKIQIIHTTPNIWNKFIKMDKYNIGYTTWETTKLPAHWVSEINRMNEIWVPCTQNIEVFKNSGVTVPIYLIPHAFNRPMFEQETGTLNMTGVSGDDFLFYSIFQWTERKNPLAILKAYLTEFRADEKVALMLKTYLVDPTDQKESIKIKAMIQEVKDKLYLKSYPKIYLVTSLLSKPQVDAIHRQGNCYLSFHRNEGFGIPLAEAMMAGNPVISTAYGGPSDFVRWGLFNTDCTGFPVKYQLTPCYGMPWETYDGSMNWADIDVIEAKEKMRWVYSNKEKAKEIGLQGQKYIDTNHSWQAIGNLMKERLEQCQK